MASTPMAPGNAGSSTRPYLIRALHDWCTDNGFTPYLAVFVDRGVHVPAEYVKNNEIVLNVSFEATTALKLGNELIEFKARFGGIAREIAVPVDHVIAIYARENGQGMAFPMPSESAAETAGTSDDATPADRPVGGGLRLATTEGHAEPAALAPAPAPAGESDEDKPPEPPASGGGPRPALKRIK